MENSFLSPEADSEHDRDRRNDPRAFSRLNAYREIADGIRAEGLGELERAWWAFFIASQALAFPGMGLTGPQLAGISEMSARLLPDEGVERALRFAVALSQRHATPLQARMVEWHFSRLIKPDMAAGNVVEFGKSDKSINDFLQKTIGGTIWRRLHEQTRRDLVEVEKLWSTAAPEFGAGRQDWGALVALYGRAVESEVRTQLGPILGEAVSAGLCAEVELTLGGCMNAVRQVAKSLRRSNGQPLPIEATKRIERAQEFFGEHSFLSSYRNRASHGNREQPIEGEELLRWRKALFVNGLFRFIHTEPE